MKQYIALSLLVGACAVALFSLFGDDSYSRMQSLRKSIENQQDKNAELEGRVSKLQSDISAIRLDDRKLESTARNELGMARPNELIFRFDSSLDEDTAKIEAERSAAKQNNEMASASVIRKVNTDTSSKQKVNSQSVITDSAKKINP